MAKSRQQIVDAALEELGVTPIGQGSSSPEFERVQRVFDAVLAELQAQEVAAWGTDTTPDELYDAMAVYVAQRASGRVGTQEKQDEMRALGRGPYVNVVALAAKKWDGSPTGSDKF